MVRAVLGGYKQRRGSLHGALALTAVLMLLGTAAAADITITTVVDTTVTPIDGEWGTPPAIRNGHDRARNWALTLPRALPAPLALIHKP